MKRFNKQILLILGFFSLGVTVNLFAQHKPEGFGALTKGGAGGRVLTVTTLSDDYRSPQPGSLRWAVMQKGPRIIKFAVSGTIRLKSTLFIDESYLTIDGAGAPGSGICIADYPISMRDISEVILTNVRLRLGDERILAGLAASGSDASTESRGLDCVNMVRVKNVLFTNCSFSWCADELLSVVECQNVTVQWCILAEPLDNARLHPSGSHPYGANNSASTVSYHHNLIYNFDMRGPNLEANDAYTAIGYDIQMESVNNFVVNYGKSGGRYTAGIETNPSAAKGVRFMFQFINNLYINPPNVGLDIACVTKHGVSDQVQVFFAGNIGPNRMSNKQNILDNVYDDGNKELIEENKKLLKQVSSEKLFSAPIAIQVHSAKRLEDLILNDAGCFPRDAVDARVVEEVRQRDFKPRLVSQSHVGGWPEL